MQDNTKVYIGRQALFVYEKAVRYTLSNFGVVEILGRGMLASKAILIMRRILHDNPTLTLIDEHTYLDELPDNRQEFSENMNRAEDNGFQGGQNDNEPVAELDGGEFAPEQRMRLVPVYSATLSVEAPEAPASYSDQHPNDIVPEA